MAVRAVWVAVDVEHRHRVADHAPIAAGVVLGPGLHLVEVIRCPASPILEQCPLGAASDGQHTRALLHHEKRAGQGCVRAIVHLLSVLTKKTEARLWRAPALALPFG